VKLAEEWERRRPPEMMRLLGAALVLIGLSPVIGALWLLSRHMHTVGLSVDGRGALALALFVLVALICLAGGLFLLSRPQP